MLSQRTIFRLWSPLAAGLSSDLAGLAVTTSRLMFALPGLAVLLSFQRGLLVSIPRTPSITWSWLVEVIGIVVVLSICIFQLELLGAVAAAVAMLVGRASASLYLWRQVRNSRPPRPIPEENRVELKELRL